MRPANTPATFVIVSLDEALRRTGLSQAELRAERNVQPLTRMLPGGRREDAVRLPTAMLVDEG